LTQSSHITFHPILWFTFTCYFCTFAY